MTLAGLALKAVGLAGLIYVLLVAMLAALQTPMLFPRGMVSAPPPLPGTASELEIITADGNRLFGVRIPGQSDTAPLLLGFGGNAWNAADVAVFLHSLAPEHPIAAFHYRGYAPSTGQPSANAILNDALEIHAHLIQFAPETAIIAVGFSIGSGPAAHLTARRDLQGAILVTPFDSLTALARHSFPWAPVRWLFRHDMTPLDDLSATDAPVALLLATRDEVIPPTRALALEAGLAEAGRPALRVEKISAGHNDIYARPEFAPAFQRALRALSGE